MKHNGTTLPHRNGRATAAATPRTVRCAIYTRKSIEERSVTDFGSNQAQRESCEAFVKSQASLGWTCLPDRFDDEGFTGANLDRPALQRLLRQVEAGAIDVIVVYRYDRISRSLFDFLGLLRLLEGHSTAFASISEQFNTTTPSGRFALHMVMTFAEFERATIASRTADKMRAARRKGKFTGGALLLGYDRHPDGGRLVVNEPESERVREIFSLYLERRSLAAVARELNERGWTTKSWVTKRGTRHEGRPFTALGLRHLLRNHAYVGQVRLDGETFPAEHAATVDPDVFDRVAALLAAQATPGGAAAGRVRHDAPLRGLLACSCGSPMRYGYTKRRGRLYGYFRCARTRDEGAAACPGGSVAAAALERAVVDRIRVVGTDPAVRAATLAAARATGGEIDPADLDRALELWTGVWEVLLARERARVLALLLERVTFDGSAGTATLAFRATGIRALAAEAGA